MRKLLFGLVLFIACLEAFSATYYVRSDRPGETRYLQISDNATRVSFRFCDSRSKRCELLGPQKSYAKKAIRKKRNVENGRMVAVLAADAGLAVVGAVGGFYGFAVIYDVMGWGMAQAPLALVSIGGSVTVSQVAAWSTKTFDPRTYYRTAQAASGALTEKDLKAHDIVTFKNELEDVLYRLNESINPL